MPQLKDKGNQQVLYEKAGCSRKRQITVGILKKIIEIFPNPVAIIDTDGRLLGANSKLVNLLKIDRGKIAGCEITSFIKAAGNQHFTRRFLNELFTEAMKKTMKAEVLLGDRVSAEASAYALPLGRDVIILIVFDPLYKKDSILTLIEKQTRDLMKDVEKLRSIFEYSPDAIVVTDLDGTIIDCNLATLEMHHFPSKEEAIGKNIIELVSARDRKMLKEDLEYVLREGSIRNVEYSFLTNDGYEFPVDFSASVVLDAEGNPRFFVMETKDISKRKIMEEKLKQYSEHLENLVEEQTKKLREAERLAAIGELAAMIGHDLRNPLMGISAALYYIEKNLGHVDDEKMKEMLEIINECIEYSNKIVNDLLDYSREMKLDLEKADPRKVILEALSQISIPENIRVTNLVKAKPEVKIDVNKMKRVIINIVKNAVDAMPNGGKLRIESRVVNGLWRLSFSDTGIGIPEDIKKKLGKPLLTTKAKGMGLGLAICKRIVEAHGGSISVESHPGRGTTFTISIPLNLN